MKTVLNIRKINVCTLKGQTVKKSYNFKIFSLRMGPVRNMCLKKTMFKKMFKKNPMKSIKDTCQSIQLVKKNIFYKLDCVEQIIIFHINISKVIS